MLRIIFMIDDDQDDREIFEEAIRSCIPGVEVHFANDGVQALQHLESEKVLPDVIFLDYNMPRMNGVQCLSKLKSNSKTAEIPVIMYTTSGNRTHEENILSMGADYYMKKTTSFDQLCLELRRVLALVDEKIEAKNIPKD